MPSFLDLYWDLANDNPDKRVDAAEALIQGLVEKDDPEEWDYALNRLLTGLSSSRGSARLGFSMALSEVLNIRKDSVTISDLLQKAAETFAVSGGMKGAEERGLYFGRLFAVQTLAKSGMWATASLADATAFIKFTVELSMKKQWLREPSFYALSELVDRLDTLPLDRQQVLAVLLSEIKDHGLTLTCEGVAIVLSLTPTERATFASDIGWKSGDPLAKDNLLELNRVLRDLPVADNDTSSGNLKPTIHFVWRKLLNAFILRESTADPMMAEIVDGPPHKKHKKNKKSKTNASSESGKSISGSSISVAEFWRLVIDDGFFASKASPERKMRGFEIFAMWLPEVSEPAVLLTPNLLRSLNNQLAQNDRFLHKIAKRIAALIVTTAEEKGAAAAFLTTIFNINKNFDKTSKSKLVHELIPHLGSDLTSLTSTLTEELKHAQEPQEKQWYIDTLIQILKVHKSGDVDWIARLLSVLTAYAFFAGQSDQTSDLVRQRVMSILSLTMDRMYESSSLPYYVLQKITALEKEGMSPRIEFEGALAKAKKRALHSLEKIRTRRLSSRHVDSAQLQAFELLFSMVLLQIYSTDTEAVLILEEVQLVYNNFFGKEIDGGADENVDTSEVLTEVLLSFLSQQSALLRKLSEDVWASFLEQVSSKSLKILFDVLATREDTAGQEGLFDLNDDDDDDDVEMAGSDGDGVESDEHDDDSSDSESGGDGDDDDDSEAGLDEEAQKKLAEVLGVNSDDDDGDDDDEESMDDEHMAALDSQLSTIFRQRKNQISKSKQEKKDAAKARLNITLLKSRVLDLLDIYVTKQPSRVDGLLITAPALRLIQDTRDPAVSEKARELVRTKICRKTTYVLSSDEQVATALSLLESALSEVKMSSNKAHGQAASQVGVFATKLLLNHDRAAIEIVSNAYNKALLDWFNDGKNKTPPNLFINLINFLASVR